MKNDLRKELALQPDDLFVTRIKDYFTKERDGRVNTSIDKDDQYWVGVIEAVGDNIPQNWIGKILFYHKNIGMELNVLGIGKYELINKNTILIVRLDQTKEKH